MQRTNIYLEDRQTEALDRLAAEEGVSRAEVIRRLLDRALAGVGDSLHDDVARIDLAFGAMADIELADIELADAPAREPGEREEWLERMWTS